MNFVDKKQRYDNNMAENHLEDLCSKNPLSPRIFGLKGSVVLVFLFYNKVTLYKLNMLYHTIAQI